MKKLEGQDDGNSTRNVNETTLLHAVDEPSTLPHHVGSECEDISEDMLNFLPELIASVKKVTLEDAAETQIAQSDANAA
ncbi:hypothetical protein ACJX0J_021532, partial [Zea mays]